MSCVVMLLLAVPSVSVSLILLMSIVQVHFSSSRVICQYYHIHILTTLFNY